MLKLDCAEGFSAFINKQETNEIICHASYTDSCYGINYDLSEVWIGFHRGGRLFIGLLLFADQITMKTDPLFPCPLVSYEILSKSLVFWDFQSKR